MLQYAIAGLVLGGLYALVATGLVVTYRSTGVLNFAFGSMAFFIARLFYFLNSESGWSTLAAAFVSIFLAGPALGVILWALLFRHLRLAAPLIRVVATLGLSVALPPLAAMIYGDTAILSAPGLAPQPVAIVKIGGVSLSLDQLIIVGSVVFLGALGFVFIRYTNAGLRVRAMVDSRAMTSLSGSDPLRVEVAVWAFSAFLAGLVGVLVAPIIGLGSGAYVLLMVTAFGAVVAGRLRNVTVAVAAGLLLGLANGLINFSMDPSSPWTGRVIDSLPFALMFAFLLFYILTGRANESLRVGGALDRAITPALAATQSALTTDSANPRATMVVRRGGPMVMVALIAVLPLLLTGYWVGLDGLGLAFGLVFLSFTIVTGIGGMIWLCEISFAGLGACLCAQLVTMHGWPALPAALVVSLVVVPVGMIVAVVTTRLGDLYTALVTLSFGFLVERLVLGQARFDQFGFGVDMPRPSFAVDDLQFSYMVMAMFGIAALMVWRYKSSTAGMALTAVRWTNLGARTIGVSVVAMKVAAAGFAAFLAALGGAMLAMYSGAAIPSAFPTLAGLLWFAVLATMGVRSNISAAVGGLVLAFAPAIFAAYLIQSMANLPAVLFGVGAILLARDPDGIVASYARQMESLIITVVGRVHRLHPVGVGGKA